MDLVRLQATVDEYDPCDVEAIDGYESAGEIRESNPQVDLPMIVIRYADLSKIDINGDQLRQWCEPEAPKKPPPPASLHGYSHAGDARDAKVDLRAILRC